jgi:outer membrane protein OmpA-like peptidoglycan-associated protein
MQKSLTVCFLTVLTSAHFLSAPAVAQSAEEMTAEQLEAAFMTQKTRGLVIAPSANSAATTGAAVEPTEAAAQHVELADEDQVYVPISFDFDSAALRSDQVPKLATLCQVMSKIDVQTFRIVGHTDASGSADYNERLSLLRAQEVKRHMVTECGVPDSKLEAIGVGEQFPLDKANPRADENRRVEFQALS